MAVAGNYKMMEVKLWKEVTKPSSKLDFQIANLSLLKELISVIPGHADLKSNGTLKSW